MGWYGLDIVLKIRFKYWSKGLSFFGSFSSLFQILLPSGFLLGFKLFCLYLLCLFLEDRLHQHCFVFELVTLWCQIKFVINCSVDLLCGSVLFQQTPEDSLPSNPQYFCWHSAFSGTPSLSGTSVPTKSLCSKMFAGSSPGMDFLLSLHDESIFDEFANKYSRVCLSNLFSFVGVHPNSLATALEDLGC